MTPSQELVLEVLTARRRLGENLWTFASSHAKTLDALEAKGLIGQMGGIVEKTRRAWLTDKGAAEVFYRTTRKTDALLFYAFRYALGRMTYAVGDVVDELITRAPALKPADRNRIVAEIDDAIRLNMAGDPADARDWARAREALEARA